MNPNLKRLVEALRSPVPDGFIWDFRYISDVREGCGTAGCALGLAMILFREEISYDSEVLHGDFFGMSEDVFDDVFYDTKVYIERHGATGWDDVTPEMVADEITARYGT